MCDCDVGNAPSCFRAVQRKARKQHRCVECGKSILAGALYEYTSGIWDGAPSDFKTCLRCVVLREAHIKAEEALQREERANGHPRQRDWPIEGCTPTIGGVLEAIRDCIGDGASYVAHFRAARRALLAGGGT